MPTPPTLDYRVPHHEKQRGVTPEHLYRLATSGSRIAGGVGVFILLMYIVTRSEAAAFLGYIWLLPGGIITLMAGAAGLSYFGIALRNRFEPPETRRRAWLAIGCPAGTVLVAFACFWSGTKLREASGNSPLGYSTVTLVLVNTTDAPIDGITAFGTDSSTGTTDLGSIPPFATVEKEVDIPSRGDGSMHLRIRSAGESWDQEAIGYYTSGAHDRPKESIRIERPVPTTQP